MEPIVKYPCNHTVIEVHDGRVSISNDFGESIVLYIDEAIAVAETLIKLLKGV